MTEASGAGEGSGADVAGVDGGSALGPPVSMDSAVLVVETGEQVSSLISSDNMVRNRECY